MVKLYVDIGNVEYINIKLVISVDLSLKTDGSSRYIMI